MSNLNTIQANNLHREDDEYSPGRHVVDENSAFSVHAFNEIYRVFIVDICSPKSLEAREHTFIHKFKSL